MPRGRRIYRNRVVLRARTGPRRETTTNEIIVTTSSSARGDTRPDRIPDSPSRAEDENGREIGAGVTRDLRRSGRAPPAAPRSGTRVSAELLYGLL